jgi:hypothetical protein
MFLKAFTKRYFYGKACRILYTLRLFIQCFHMIGNCATDACHRLSYITSYWESLSFHLTILFQHHFIIFLVCSKNGLFNSSWKVTLNYIIFNHIFTFYCPLFDYWNTYKWNWFAENFSLKSILFTSPSVSFFHKTG